MAGSVFDSVLLGKLFATGDTGRLFSDTAEIRAMLLVEGALAKVQGALGIIPEVSAAAIARASLEVQIDPAALADPAAANGVSVPGLVAQFRTLMQAPEHAQYIHWGATSQDIIDTGLMLRLRQALTLTETDLRQTVTALASLAEQHADLPMAARTWGQQATVTSFGAVAAAWGEPLLELLGETENLRARHLPVSLSGASGTASALGPLAAQTRADLADALGLADPERSWHTDRTPVLRIADWMTRVTDALGKLGRDTIALVQTEVGEVRLGAAGSSSTMPQKQNPVGPSVLVAAARHNAGLAGTLHGAAPHLHQRDGAAWFAEWMVLPQIVLGAAASARTALTLVQTLEPQPEAMAAGLERGLDLIHAEALSFALTQYMPRPDAQEATKSLCRAAAASDTPLRTLVARDFPGLDVAALFDPARQMGQAPACARNFVQRAYRLPKQDP